jgi:hypothetical protein
MYYKYCIVCIIKISIEWVIISNSECVVKISIECVIKIKLNSVVSRDCFWYSYSWPKSPPCLLFQFFFNAVPWKSHSYAPYRRVISPLSYNIQHFLLFFVLNVSGCSVHSRVCMCVSCTSPIGFCGLLAGELYCTLLTVLSIYICIC